MAKVKVRDTVRNVTCIKQARLQILPDNIVQVALITFSEGETDRQTDSQTETERESQTKTIFRMRVSFRLSQQQQ